jgi:hypothetical protein
MSRWWQRRVGAADPLVGAPVLVSETPTPTPAPVPVIPPPVAPAPALVPTPAGVWWCAQFPGSNRLEDLAEPFREDVERFVADLRARGCTVEITATRRPEQRAWLMRQCWDIVHGLVRLDEVPVRPDIPVQPWTLVGALDMRAEYGLVYQPALDSLHIRGLALDMHVHDWMGSDADLWALGASFDVLKLITDPTHQRTSDAVHWSSTGH